MCHLLENNEMREIVVREIEETSHKPRQKRFKKKIWLKGQNI